MVDWFVVDRFDVEGFDFDWFDVDWVDVEGFDVDRFDVEGLIKLINKDYQILNQRSHIMKWFLELRRTFQCLIKSTLTSHIAINVRPIIIHYQYIDYPDKTN